MKKRFLPQSNALRNILFSLLLMCLSSAQGLLGTIVSDPPEQWRKGNLHTHTFWSDDNDFPEIVTE